MSSSSAASTRPTKISATDCKTIITYIAAHRKLQGYTTDDAILTDPQGILMTHWAEDRHDLAAQSEAITDLLDAKTHLEQLKQADPADDPATPPRDFKFTATDTTNVEYPFGDPSEGDNKEIDVRDLKMLLVYATAHFRRLRGVGIQQNCILLSDQGTVEWGGDPAERNVLSGSSTAVRTLKFLVEKDKAMDVLESVSSTGQGG